MIPIALQLFAVYTVLTTAFAASSKATANASTIDWTDCSTEGTPELKCANLSVPMDWANPAGDYIRLGLSMRAARNPSQRIGPLLFNTGGPGAVATFELMGNGSGIIPFSNAIRDRFDLVAMDPRGIGSSQPVYCDHDAFNDAMEIDPWVTTDTGFMELKSAWGRFGESCYNLTGPYMDHLDSTTAAKDLEAVRVALGGEPLTYLGISYGTVIGTAYVELFPHQVRAMALDGDIDHSQLQPYLVLTESRTYEEALNNFFTWCDNDPSCAIHNTTFPTSNLWDSLIERASTKAIPARGCSDPTQSCAQNVVAYQIILEAQGHLLLTHTPPDAPYLAEIAWPALGRLLHDAYYMDDTTGFSRNIVSFDNASSAYITPAVYCSDWNVSVPTLEEYINLQLLLNSTSPHTKGVCEFFQVIYTCMAWPASPAYPSHIANVQNTAAPVLLVNSFFDVESSYEWAVALQHQIDNSTLLSRNGSGHTSYPLKGDAHGLIEKYLIDVEVPRPGTVANS